MKTTNQKEKETEASKKSVPMSREEMQNKIMKVDSIV
jgi:hypothetical protein